MVNVGSGNLVLQDDDMTVPHKGVALDFLRTYNSQSQHDVNGTDGSTPSLYGNGWSNTFDAHLSSNSPGVTTVWDGDGSRYDYTLAGDGVTWTAPPGQHATLTWDQGCGYLWTKKSGVSYYFWQAPNGPCGPTYGGQYAGKLYQIIGRNRNTYITFNYGWDIGTHTAGDKISSITATTESGLAANLSFTDVSGHRLLHQIVFPDNSTSVSYLYDTAGNLLWVSRPPNNSTGTRPMPGYIYSTLGTGSVMAYVTSPRWNGSDGGYIAIGYNGTNAYSASVGFLGHVANANPSIADGSASSTLQSGYSTAPYNFYNEYFSAGAAASTYRDSNGHATNWVVDPRGRPTQTQLCTESVNQGQTCTGTWLVMNESWDVNNNRTSMVSPRGGVTRMVYDANGNVVAIAQPPQYQGYNPPTTLIDYDSFSNVTAYCDPVLVHSITADYWNGQYDAGADNYCSSQFSTNHPSAQYTYPSYQPNGELAAVVSATGYTRSISYQATSQGGADYGLPTDITGTTIQQFDGSTRRPIQSASYDAHGNLVCAKTDTAASASGGIAATTVMTYDALNRLVASGDPDDASLTGSCSTKTAGIPSSTIVTARTYFADGSLATTKTPSEAALNAGTAYAYDLDGDLASVAPFNPSLQTARLKLWFDGVDRLVETQQPADPGTPGDIPISLRYLYDLSQTGSATTLTGTAVTAHGNLYDVLKNTPNGWIDFRYAAADAVDRTTRSYAFAPCPAQVGPPAPAGAIYCSQAAYSTRYDWDQSPSLNPGAPAPGLLVASLDGMGISRAMTYDGLESVDTVNYSGATSGHAYAHDFDNRLAQTDDVGYAYNADGTSVGEVSANTSVVYSYYPDSTRSGVSATTSRNSTGDIVSQPNLYSYAYRNDGLLVDEAFGVSSQSVAWTYTRGGRMTAMNDFNDLTPSVSAQYADGHGRLSTYVTPSGTYAGFVYDAQGRLTQYTDPYNRIDGETVSSAYNVRGDLVARTFTGGVAASKPGFQYKNVQGVLVQNATDQYDGRTGAMLLTRDFGAFQYDQVGRLTSGGGSFAYDADSRLVSGDTWNASSAADDDCHSGGAVASGVPPPKEQSYSYDGAGRISQDTLQTGGLRRWAWSGNSLLYTMPVTYSYNGAAGPGAPYGFGADGLGSITADGSAPGLTISDVDFDGAVAQYHNNTGHSAWTASNPYNQFCQHATPLAASPHYGQVTAAVPGDGSSDPSLTVTSSGRAYLSRSMGFTTPDNSSSMPYAPGSRRLSGFQDTRPTVADASCTSGQAWVNADKSHECIPTIGGTGTSSGGGGANGGGGGGGGSTVLLKGLRPPDYTQYQICGGPRGLATCFQGTLDKCGRAYVSLPFMNASIGKNPGFVASSLTSGWVGATPQSPDAIANVLSQGSWNVSAGSGAGVTVGGNVTFSWYNPEPMLFVTRPSISAATGVNNVSFGQMTPQIGAMVGYNLGPFDLFNSGLC